MSVVLIIAACSAPTEAPAVDAAQSFRPLGALFFLPSYAPPPSGEAALVPDSKIAWDLRVVAKSLGLREVDVTVHKQVARLRGFVPSEEARQTLIRVVEKSRGVRQVVDTLEVRP